MLSDSKALKTKLTCQNPQLVINNQDTMLSTHNMQSSHEDYIQTNKPGIQSFTTHLTLLGPGQASVPAAALHTSGVSPATFSVIVLWGRQVLLKSYQTAAPTPQSFQCPHPGVKYNEKISRMI